MNKNKIFIYSLIFIFTLSNVGLPFTLHICSVMKTVSFEKCEMCREAETQTHSCCEMKRNIENYKIKFDKKCCESRVLASPLSDKFIPSENLFKVSNIKTLEIVDLQADNLSEFYFTLKYYFDSSPPQLNLNNIYLINSILLI